jgi:hypothetical protein
MVPLLRQDNPRHNPMRSIQSACQTAQLTLSSNNHADTAHSSRFPEALVSSSRSRESRAAPRDGGSLRPACDA